MWIVDYWSQIDWDATGSMLSGLGTLGGALAVYAAAKIGFSAWRRQKLAERNRDQAEAILHAAYNARRALRYLRSPLMTAHELAAAEDALDTQNQNWRSQMAEERQKRVVTAQGYFTRANQCRDDRTKLEECMPMARALFGEELEQGIETLHHQFHSVLTYAQAYIDDYNGNDRQFSVAIRRALFASGHRREGDANEVFDAIETSIETIENICLPYLRMEGL